MIIQQALLKAIKKLQRVKSASAHLDAEVLLSYIVKKPSSFIHMHHEKKLTASQTNKFNTLVNKRLRGIPVAYLTGQKEFYGLNFFITKDVLVPRPETETLVEEAIKEVRHIKLSKNNEKIIIADIGTGSGCMAVTLAKYLPFVNVIATDISNKTLRIAKKNARQYKVLKKIKFIKGNLLKPLKKTKPDIIVSNLPYLTRNELANVKHEPKQALYGGKMGLELIEKLISQASEFITKKTVIILEISPSQIKAVDYFVEQHLPDRQISFVKDLAGRDRVVKIK